MTKHELLKTSITEFKDKKINALYFECKRVMTESGYVYLIKPEKGVPFSCAIHFNRYWETDESIGKYENKDVSINTAIELPKDCVIEYKGLVIAIESVGNYNAEMRIFHYHGSGAISPISNKFYIVDELEIEQKLGVNSLPIFLNMDLGYPIIPAFFEVLTDKQYIMVSCGEETCLTPVFVRDLQNIQYKFDNVELSLVNLSTFEAQSVLRKIQENSLRPDSLFGLCSNIELSNRQVYQKSFNWKSLTYTSTFKINYALTSKIDENDNIIKTLKEVFFKQIRML